MIPVELKLSGFLSYREPVELDFTGFDLACISGPNGAGKSSLLDAITWVLFGRARTTTEALINLQSEAAEVVLVFDYEGNRYRIQRTNPRGKTSLLEFQIFGPDGTWKPLGGRTLRDTQAQIEETLRLDYETFVNASFFLQGKADQFTQHRPGERKRILAGILGLDVWEQYRREAVEARKKVEAEIAVVDGRLAEIEAELGEEKARREALETIETELARLTELRAAKSNNLENARRLAAQLEEQKIFVETLERQAGEAEQALEEGANRLESRQEEQRAFANLLAREDDIRGAYSDWQAAQAELERWDEVAARFQEGEIRRQAPLREIETARVRLEEEQKGLHSAQEEAHKAQSELQVVNGQLAEAESQVKTLETQLAEKAAAEAALEEARQALSAAQAENPHLKREMVELKERIDQLKAVEGATCPTCGQPLSEAERAALVAALEVEGAAMGDKYRANQELLQKSDEIVRARRERLDEFSKVEARYHQETRRYDQFVERQRTLEAVVEAWQRERAARLEEVQQVLEKESFAPEARARLAEIDLELKEIGYDAARHDVVRKKVAQGKSIGEELRALERAQAALEPLEREISDLQSQMARQTKTLQARQEEYAEAAQRLETAQETSPDLRQAERELLEIQERENRLRMQVGAARQKVEVLSDLKDRRKEYQARREEFTQEVMRFKQLERAFGKDGVPALLIEQALPQIEARANEILDRLSDGAMTVRFVTQAAYLDTRRDDLRETLDIQISDSAGVRDYEMYSGGEAFRVNFAVRLALSEMLAHRAGARLQTLVIDEGFGSQDALGRQRLVEAINIIREDFAKILVITHIDALKDAFPVRIEVSKTPEGSQVQLT